jgi:hypothetical protein
MNSEISYISRLKVRLRKIQERFTVILQSSKLEQYVHPSLSSPWASLGSNRPQKPNIGLRWASLSPELEREQNQILKDFEEWHIDFIGLFSNATRDEDKQLKMLYLEMDSWLKNRKWRELPNSINNAIALFEATCDKFIGFLDQVTPSTEAHLVFIIDTSAILDCPDILQMSRFINVTTATFVFPSTTISELDDLKTGKRDENFRRRLTAAINHLSETMDKGDVLEGIGLSGGVLVKMLAAEPDFSNLPKWLDPSTRRRKRMVSLAKVE